MWQYFQSILSKEQKTAGRPEIGNFKLFWEDLKTLRDKNQNTQSGFVASRERILAGIFMLYDSEHSSSHLLDIGEKIDMLLSSTEADKAVAEDIIFILDMRCSVYLHPNWEFVNEPSSYPDPPSPDTISRVRGITTRVLNWFCMEWALGAGCEVPTERKRDIVYCRGIFHLSIDNGRMEQPSFDDWVTFLRRKSEDSFDPGNSTCILDRDW